MNPCYRITVVKDELLEEKDAFCIVLFPDFRGGKPVIDPIHKNTISECFQYVIGLLKETEDIRITLGFPEEELIYWIEIVPNHRNPKK